MKEVYKRPTVTVLMIKLRTTVLTGSPGSDIEVMEIINELGSEDDFG